MHDFVMEWGWLILFLAAVLACTSYVFLVFPYQKRRQRERELHLNTERRVRDTFDVELSKINEQTTQNKIIQTIDALAIKAATVCMYQNMKNRGEKLKETPHSLFAELAPDISWEGAADRFKHEWNTARILATYVYPETMNRTLFFADYEPLKSYNSRPNKPGQAVRLKLLRGDEKKW